jgi:hypothetical protein
MRRTSRGLGSDLAVPVGVAVVVEVDLTNDARGRFNSDL